MTLRHNRIPAVLTIVLFLSCMLCSLSDESTLSSVNCIPVINSVSAAPDKGSDNKSLNNLISSVPAYSNSAFVEVNGNSPFFKEKDLTTKTFEKYSRLDNLGRCGVAYANISRETLPTEERGPIGMIRPSGWHTTKYNDLIDGNYLYNRCHLIAYQLSGENANERNLFTGTRYLNVEGMLPFENRVADYVKNNDCHVLYRVTPLFKGNNLLASGVLMEAESVEDKGAGLAFCVYVYNVQPHIVIDYATGDSHAKREKSSAEKTDKDQITDTSHPQPQQGAMYILNMNTKRFHYPDCRAVADMKESNKIYSDKSRNEIISMGYQSCGICHP